MYGGVLKWKGTDCNGSDNIRKGKYEGYCYQYLQFYIELYQNDKETLDLLAKKLKALKKILNNPEVLIAQIEKMGK